jgi:hypothetical protein
MRIRTIHIVLLLTILSFFSCTKEYSYEGGPPQPQGDFRAMIDGVQWMASDTAEGATILAGLINISGVSTDNKQVSLTLDDTVTGVYILDQLTSSLGSYIDHDSSNVYAFTTNQGADTTQAGGTVTVTEIDKVNKTISGTFACKMYRDIDSRGKTFTQGVFYKLPYASSLPVANSGDTMYATIDGAAWVAQSIQGTAVAPQLAIVGSAVSGSPAVSLVIPLTTGPGTYALSISGLTYIGIYNPTLSTALTSASGTLTILENDPATKRVRGNFSFTATDPSGQSATTDQLTNGYFSVKYN